MNWHRQHRESRDRLDRIADGVTDFIGSPVSIILHSLLFFIWIYKELDILVLTTVVWLEAIYLCLFLQMSSNRHGERDRHQAQADYETNINAEGRIEELQIALARIEEDKLDRIIELLMAPKRK